MKITKVTAALFLAALALAGTVSANQIKSVIVVDFLHVEVVMKEALPQEELTPDSQEWLTDPPFIFSGGVKMTGMPVKEDVRGYDNTYRIPVNGLDEDTIYTVSYRGEKKKTFKTYETEKEMSDRYKNRYGDYF